VAIVPKELPHSLVLMNLQIVSFLQQNDEEAQILTQLCTIYVLM